MVMSSTFNGGTFRFSVALLCLAVSTSNSSNSNVPAAKQVVDIGQLNRPLAFMKVPIAVS